MSEQDNINVVHANYEAFNAHDLAKWSQLRTADFLAEQTGEPTPFNVEQHRRFLQGYLTAFPDAHIEVTFIIAQGNYVVEYWTGTGTHTGPLHTATGGSIPATGKKVVLKASETYALNGGKTSLVGVL
jgi:predicted ester cyclase